MAQANAVSVPHGTEGFEVGTESEAFFADGTPVPDNRNDGAPMKWYDGRFWFDQESDAQAYAAELNEDPDAQLKRQHEDGSYTVKKYVVKGGVKLFGGLAGTDNYGF